MIDETTNVLNETKISDKSKGTVELLCFFFGAFGIHRFYVGKIGTGILWLFTFGLFGFGAIIDLIVLICGKFKDKDGYYITNKKHLGS